MPVRKFPANDHLSGNNPQESSSVRIGHDPTGTGRYLVDSLTPANHRHKNPRPALAERPGISCSTEGCGSLVIVGSLTNRNDRSVLFRHHVIPIDLAPLISRWRTAKVVLLIIDLIASVPVFLLNLCARLPFVVLLVSVVVGMILGHGRHACQSHSQDGKCECYSNRFHECSWELDSALEGIVVETTLGGVFHPIASPAS